METGKIKSNILTHPRRSSVIQPLPASLYLIYYYYFFSSNYIGLHSGPWAPILLSSILPQELRICCSTCMKKTCLLTFRSHFTVHHFFRETSFASGTLPFKHTHSFLCCAKPPFVALLTDIIKKLIGGDLWEYTGLS